MSTPSFNLADAPMAKDRTEGWKYFRSFGDVFEADGTYFLTGAGEVNFAYSHAEIFSSAKAFESLGSPIHWCRSPSIHLSTFAIAGSSTRCWHLGSSTPWKRSSVVRSTRSSASSSTRARSTAWPTSLGSIRHRSS